MPIKRILIVKKAATVLIIKNAKVLAISRKNDHTNFGLVGGKCKENETFEQCAIRETYEETGLTIYELTLVFTRQDDEYEVQTFIPKSYSGTIVESDEGIVRWVSPEVVMAGTFGQYNANLFKHLGIIK